MGKGGIVRANLQATRTRINNAQTSAQARAFRARQLAKQQRAAEERKLRAARAAEDAKTSEPTSDDAPPKTDD